MSQPQGSVRKVASRGQGSLVEGTRNIPAAVGAQIQVLTTTSNARLAVAGQQQSNRKEHAILKAFSLQNLLAQSQ
jgi:hypothetical protein